MSAQREVLPNRRRSETFEFEAGVPGQPSQHYVATLGFYPDGRVGEIFIHAAKSGSDRDIAMQEVGDRGVFRPATWMQRRHDPLGHAKNQ